MCSSVPNTYWLFLSSPPTPTPLFLRRFFLRGSIMSHNTQRRELFLRRPSTYLSLWLPSASLSLWLPSASLSLWLPSASLSLWLPSASLSLWLPSASLFLSGYPLPLFLSGYPLHLSFSLLPSASLTLFLSISLSGYLLYL